MTKGLSDAAKAQRQRARDGVCVEPDCGSRELHRHRDGSSAVRCTKHETMMVRKHFDRIGKHWNGDLG